MKRTVSLLLIGVFATSVSAFAGISGSHSMYIGGTAPGLAKDTDGVLNADDSAAAVFRWNKGEWKVPYDKVTGLSYGQHAGRRVGAAVLVSPVLLFSKKRRHYLTVEYADDQGKPQAAIFEVGKDAIRTLLKTLEVRTGKKIDYEDEEARKAGNK